MRSALEIGGPARRGVALHKMWANAERDGGDVRGQEVFGDDAQRDEGWGGVNQRRIFGSYTSYH